jgi:DNA-binding transcriptional LysR family regulator
LLRQAAVAELGVAVLPAFMGAEALPRRVRRLLDPLVHELAPGWERRARLAAS